MEIRFGYSGAREIIRAEWGKGTILGCSSGLLSSGRKGDYRVGTMYEVGSENGESKRESGKTG